MSPNQSDGGMQRISAKIQSHHKAALEQLAHARSTPNRRVYVSEFVRDSLEVFFKENWEDLPQDVRDVLEEDPRINPEIEADEVEA